MLKREPGGKHCSRKKGMTWTTMAIRRSWRSTKSPHGIGRTPKDGSHSSKAYGTCLPGDGRKQMCRMNGRRIGRSIVIQFRLRGGRETRRSSRRCRKIVCFGRKYGRNPGEAAITSSKGRPKNAPTPMRKFHWADINALGQSGCNEKEKSGPEAA